MNRIKKKSIPTNLLWLFIIPFLIGCMKWDYSDKVSDFKVSGNGLYIVCEGNFQYGNATLSYYDPIDNSVENEVFFRANGMKLGDVAQSMTIYDDKAWIVVNNSHVIFAIDPFTFKEIGRIENLTSPRYIHFISPEKAYVTQLWDNRIFIINPTTYSVTGYINIPDMEMATGSTEQMVQWDHYVYCNCWSYQNRILKIDTETDQVVDELKVGVQPNSLAIDSQHRIWTLTEGDLNSAIEIERPTLFCIDPESFSIIKSFQFDYGSSPSELQVDVTGNSLFWVNNDIWKMNVNDNSLPARPLIESIKTRYYGLTTDPNNGDIYVADAIDYMQQGIIYRFTNTGEPISSFYVGITPGAFCWNNNE